MGSIRVMVVDDQRLFREALVRLLVTQPDIEVVAQAEDGLEALEKAREFQPDLVLLDIKMPRMDGLEATRRLKAEMPQVKIIILTVSDAESDLFEALKHGAIGYLLKNMKADTLFQKIREVQQGEVVLSPLLATRLAREFARLKQLEVEQASLGISKREVEVLRMVADGFNNKEIGDKLFIAEATVKRHLHNILQKLHAKNRAEAAAYGIRTGLISPFQEG